MKRRAFLSSPTLAMAAADAQKPAESALRVAACQILTFPEVTRSAEKLLVWMEKAAKEKIDVITFPEACLCGYTEDAAYWKAANPAEFQAAESRIVSAARRLNLAVILGTAHWEDRKIYNSVLVIDRDGSVRGRYSKTHLAEPWSTAGRKLPVWTVAGVKSCFLICHDIRYPELVRLPAIAGAQICYLSSNEGSLVNDEKLSAYRAMPISRATENSIYLVMANAPADPKNMFSTTQSHGNSKIIHPNGAVLTEAGFFKETLVSAVIDLKAADRAVAKRAVDDDTILAGWLRHGARLVET